MDTMFINKEGMLTAINKSVKFQSLIPIANRTHDEYYKALDNISSGITIRVDLLSTGSTVMVITGE